MRDFRNLDAWHKAHTLALSVHRASDSFPRSETFGMAATLRRGSAHFAMKIAEACGQDSTAEFVSGLGRARACGMELEYQLLLARDLQLVKPQDHDVLQAQVIEVRKMLSGLMKTAAV